MEKCFADEMIAKLVDANGPCYHKAPLNKTTNNSNIDGYRWSEGLCHGRTDGRKNGRPSLVERLALRRKFSVEKFQVENKKVCCCSQITLRFLTSARERWRTGAWCCTERRPCSMMSQCPPSLQSTWCPSSSLTRSHIQSVQGALKKDTKKETYEILVLLTTCIC